jgi:hypothetical protein
VCDGAVYAVTLPENKGGFLREKLHEQPKVKKGVTLRTTTQVQECSTIPLGPGEGKQLKCTCGVVIIS